MSDSHLPTQASFELGAKIGICSTSNREDDLAQTAADALHLVETMLSIRSYQTLIEKCHAALYHLPEISGSCLTHKQALASIVAQIFACGWAAGRQEVIDLELAKMAAGEKS